MKLPKSLKLGTRGSALALVQARFLQSLLQKKNPDCSVELVTIETSGDRFKGKILAEAGGKGLFVKEIEEALLEKKIDFAVHSLKDLPGILPQGLTLACFPKREDPRDCFVSLKYKNFEALPKGAIVATTSPRRTLQIKAMRPDLAIEPIRGNVDTRLKKLEAGHCDALILAAAGLKRLQKSSAITHFFEPDVLIPAVGQGVLGIEIRKEDAALEKILREGLEDSETVLQARAERAFLKKIGGDCYTPLAAFAKIEGEKIKMTGWLATSWLATTDGKKSVRRDGEGPTAQPEALGKKLAEEILDALAHHETA